MNLLYKIKTGRLLLLVFFSSISLFTSAQCSDTPVLEAVRNGNFEAGYLTSNGAGKHNFTANGPFDFGSDLTFTGNFTSPMCKFSIANQYGTGKVEPGMTCTASPRQAYSGTDYINVNFVDHTPGQGGNGFALIADFESFGGGSSYGAPGLPAAWRQNVTIYPNQKYYFSAWFANYNRDAATGAYNTPDLNFVVIPINAGGTLVMAERQVLGTATPTGQMAWQQFYGTWTPTGIYTRVALFIEVQQATATNTNDLLIDDISFINGCTNLTALPASITPNLGPGFSLCLTNGTATLNANISQTASTQFWWYSGAGVPQTTLVSASSTQETWTISAPGTYRVCVQDASFPAGCSASSTIVVTNTMPPVTLSNQVICAAASVTLTASLTGTGLTYNWYKRPGAVANPGNVSSLTTSTTGTYGVQVTSPVAGCGTVTSNDAIVTSNLATPTLTSANCTGSPKTFGVTATGGGSGFTWWNAATGGTAIGSGTPATLSYATMPSPATVWVENYTPMTLKPDVAATNASNGGGDTWTYSAFDVTQAFTLASVDVQPIFCGTTFTISLYRGGVLQNTTTGIPCAPTGVRTIALNYNIPVGTGYELRITGGGAWFNINPSTSPASITSTLATIYTSVNGYGAFSNWVTKPAGGCMRVPLNLDCTLPVKFISLTAQETNSSVAIHWSIAEDADRSAYIIERSTGSASNFVRIGEVPTGIRTSGVAEYSFIDFEVEPGLVYYYRIAKAPEEGGLEYSSIAAVELSAGATLVSVAPNPYSNATTVSNTQNTPVTVSITDVQGRVLSSTTLASNEVKEVGAGLSPGLYILRAQRADGRVQVLRLVKAE